MAVNTFFSCPDDCSVFTFSALPTDPNCVTLPTTSEIGQLFIVPKLTDGSGNYATNPFTDWGTGIINTSGTPTTATAGAIDNTSIDNTKSHQLTGIGTLAAPEKQTQIMPGFVEITSLRTYTLNFEIKSLPDTVYNYLVQLQCNKVDSFLFYYADATYVYGSLTGIKPNKVDVDFVHEAGKASVTTATLMIQYDAIGDPERRLNPYS